MSRLLSSTVIILEHLCGDNRNIPSQPSSASAIDDPLVGGKTTAGVPILGLQAAIIWRQIPRPQSDLNKKP